ncbi:alkanesulfonate monooxygenase, partial [Rhizobium ruizarguesonis]
PLRSPAAGSLLPRCPERPVRSDEIHWWPQNLLSGMPLLEEAYRFGEKVLPRLDVSREVSKTRNYTWSTLFDRDLSNAKSA